MNIVLLVTCFLMASLITPQLVSGQPISENETSICVPNLNSNKSNDLLCRQTIPDNSTMNNTTSINSLFTNTT